MENKSIWELTTSIGKREQLVSDIECDILIVGAGLAGCLLGYFLSLENKNVVIVEAKTIASGTTKNTTSKITLQHSLIYNKLLKTIGYKKTRLFYEANKDALDKYKEIISKNNIDCDFELSDSYVYTLRDTDKLKKEFKAYTKLGIPGELTRKVNLPFEVKEALVIKNQAMFNPLKFIKNITNNLKIYEHSKVTKIDNHVAICENGYQIKAHKIVVATHFPIVDNFGYYFLKQHQDKSYLLALSTDTKINGMFIDENIENGFTLRNYKDVILFGGYSHKTGKKGDEDYFAKLENASNKFFTNSKVIAKFSAQDCMSLDHMPYLGQYDKKHKDMYVMTGFNKWGMTGCMLGAMIVSDLINERNNKYADLLSPSRFNLFASLCNLKKNSLESINSIFLKRALMKRKDIINLNNDESLIVKYKKKYLGIYKDENGELYIVDVRCPHLGCILSFNKKERTYECPCHGSKFNYKGELLSSPSIYNTKKYDL